MYKSEESGKTKAVGRSKSVIVLVFLYHPCHCVEKTSGWLFYQASICVSKDENSSKVIGCYIFRCFFQLLTASSHKPPKGCVLRYEFLHYLLGGPKVGDVSISPLELEEFIHFVQFMVNWGQQKSSLVTPIKRLCNEPSKACSKSF